MLTAELTTLSERRLLQLLCADDRAAADLLLAWAEPDALPAVVEAARRTGLTPALYSRLRPHADLVPAGLLAPLEQAYWQTAAVNALRFHELGRVLGALAGAGMPVLALKGAALAESLYDNVALRPMSDVDLLLHKADLPRAVSLLGELGYRAEWREAQAGLGLEYESQVELRGPEPDWAVELHWHLLDAAYYIDRLPEARLWEEAVPIRLAEREVLAFRPEATLVHLAAHYVLHHGGHGLLWLHDLAQLLRHVQADPAADPWAVNWDGALALAGRWQLVLPLQRAVEDAIAGAELAFPADLRQRLRELAPARGELRAYRALTSPRRDVISRFYQELVMIQGGRRKLRYLWHNLFPARDYMVERYAIPAGRAVWPYHVYRVAKGLADLAGRLLRRPGRAP